MKKEELRFGNCYQSVIWNVPVKCDLTDLYNLSANADGADDDPPIDEMFEPIPLTEEWLIKFGFKLKKKLQTSRSYTLSGINIEVYVHGRLPHPIQRIDYCECQYDIKSVHQLQFIYFALTGKELMV